MRIPEVSENGGGKDPHLALLVAQHQATEPLAFLLGAANAIEHGDMLTATDRDAGDTAIMAQSNTVGAYGTFNISINGIWNYALNNSAANVQALNAGQTVTDTFAVATAGGVTRNVVISIAGASIFFL